MRFLIEDDGTTSSRFGNESHQLTNLRLKAVHNAAQGRATKERHPGFTNPVELAIRGNISKNGGRLISDGTN